MNISSESLSPTLGLNEAEASARLKEEGFNELPRPDRRTPLRILLEVLREPMIAFLLAGGAIYLLLGDLKEALILIVFAGMSVVITVVQETRTERVLEALRDLTSPRALVIRDGKRRRIAGRDVVRGDAVLVGEGDRIPADARLLQSRDMLVDESLLTGESVPVRKIAANIPPSVRPRPGGDDLPYIYSGSLVVGGSGIAEVTATGSRSEIGRIGQSLRQLEAEPPRLQAQIRRLVRLAALGGGIVTVLAVALYGMTRGGWLDAILAGITIGMSMLPEEFPVVLAVFMAMGAWRISRVRVLTRRASAIEALGSATVLCTDKTGTLTENRMSIATLRLKNGNPFRVRESFGASLGDELAELVEFGLLASAQEPFDPMEKAFHELAHEHLAEERVSGLSRWKLLHTYGLRPELLAMTQAWQSDGQASPIVIAAKGAPEAIADLCRFSAVDMAAMKQAVDAMAADGLRMLGVAKASYPRLDLPDSQRDFDFQFLGLVGLADALRTSVPAAVTECRSAGIRIIMITGDYPLTAVAIARQAGLDATNVLSGNELESLEDTELAGRLKNTNIFARVTPELKLRIVQSLKAGGEIVAMTGDGVNDAPSLKAAHIGVAMGGRGTDVAREASSIVLLDDDFGSIVKAVRLGRRIYDNLRKAMGFIFAVHVPIAGLALLPLAFGLPIIFSPVHIAFLEMIIDPVCSLVFEAETEEEDVMDRPPRPPNEPLFSRALIVWSLLQGLLTLGLAAAIYLVGLRIGLSEEEVRGLTFVSLVLSIISLILINRSFSASLMTALRRPNPTLLWILLAMAGILIAVLSVPSLSALFRFGSLHQGDWALAVGASLMLLTLAELLKPLWRKSLRF
jgi:Ca2+-transporting ATPase